MSRVVLCGFGVAPCAGVPPPPVRPPPPPVPGIAAPVASAEDALPSTWYCAGGTAAEGGIADHRVEVLNPTGGEVAGRLTVHSGALDGSEAVEPPIARLFTVAPG